MRLLSVVSSLLLPNILTAASFNLTEEEKILLEYEAPEEIKKAFPYYLSGYDDAGAPIWIFELGRWNLRKYIEIGGDLFEAMDKHGRQMLLRFRESGRRATEKSGEDEHPGFISIMDMDNFPLSQMSHPRSIQFLLRHFKIFDEFLDPGDLKFSFIINANSLFEGVWNLGKPLLGPFVNSIEVYGNNRRIWQVQLFKRIPQNQLPKIYGGPSSHKNVKIFE